MKPSTVGGIDQTYKALNEARRILGEQMMYLEVRAIKADKSFWDAVRDDACFRQIKIAATAGWPDYCRVLGVRGNDYQLEVVIERFPSYPFMSHNGLHIDTFAVRIDCPFPSPEWERISLDDYQAAMQDFLASFLNAGETMFARRTHGPSPLICKLSGPSFFDLVDNARAALKVRPGTTESTTMTNRDAVVPGSQTGSQGGPK